MSAFAIDIPAAPLCFDIVTYHSSSRNPSHNGKSSTAW